MESVPVLAMVSVKLSAAKDYLQRLVIAQYIKKLFYSISPSAGLNNSFPY